MRIIKLSPSDPDMKSRPMVDRYFGRTLAERNPKGQFFLTAGRIAEKGVSVAERLLFTYEGNCIYEARAASGRVKNEGKNSGQYPFYFCVDMDTLQAVQGSLSDFEVDLHQSGRPIQNLVKSQGWPIVAETDAIDHILREMRCPFR